MDTDAEELEDVLYKVQNFEPAGIGARNLQECLLLQLERKDPEEEVNRVAYEIIDRCFNEFSKKHYDKIARKLSISDEEMLKEAISIVTKLNPKPGGSGE